MNKLIYYLQLAVLLLFSGNCFSQQVMATAGESSAGTGIQLSWTIGEPVIETFTTSSVILTQGFHQSKLLVTALDELALPALELKVFPNPFFNQLHVDVTKGDWNKLHFCLYATDGKILLRKPAQSRSEILDMEPYTSGIYFLKVTGNSGEPVQTFKVVKN